VYLECTCRLGARPVPCRRKSCIYKSLPRLRRVYLRNQVHISSLAARSLPAGRQARPERLPAAGWPDHSVGESARAAGRTNLGTQTDRSCRPGGPKGDSLGRKPQLAKQLDQEPRRGERNVHPPAEALGFLSPRSAELTAEAAGAHRYKRLSSGGLHPRLCPSVPLGLRRTGPFESIDHLHRARQGPQAAWTPSPGGPTLREHIARSERWVEVTGPYGTVREWSVLPTRPACVERSRTDNPCPPTCPA